MLFSFGRHSYKLLHITQKKKVQCIEWHDFSGHQWPPSRKLFPQKKEVSPLLWQVVFSWWKDTNSITISSSTKIHTSQRNRFQCKMNICDESFWKMSHNDFSLNFWMISMHFQQSFGIDIALLNVDRLKFVLQLIFVSIITKDFLQNLMSFPKFLIPGIKLGLSITLWVSETKIAGVLSRLATIWISKLLTYSNSSHFKNSR